MHMILYTKCTIVDWRGPTGYFGYCLPVTKTTVHTSLRSIVCVFQGMGGQHGYFGLWLDSDFGRGHSRARPKCTTYGSPQLSAEEDFSLEAVEVWAVSEPPEQEQVGT